MKSNKVSTIKINLPPKTMTEDIDELKLEHYFIAYIDFLGMKNMMNSDNSLDFLKILHQLYDNTISGINAIKKELFINDIKIKIFSDNIIFAIKIPKNNKNSFWFSLNNFINLMSIFQMEALMCGFTLRGGITKGELFFNDIYTYGPAIIRAYDLESKNAIYPRIVIDPLLIEDYKSLNIERMCILKDFDDLFYIDYLIKLFSGTCNYTLENIRKMIMYLYQQNKTPAITQIYSWLINKFNNYCINDFSQYYIDSKNLPKLVKIKVK